MEMGKIRYSYHTIDEFLDAYLNSSGTKFMIGNSIIKRNSDRYRLFANKGTTCVTCGIEANTFIVETFSTVQNPHGNLYYISDNVEILFTKDHIIPKSRGGLNIFENYQTMCSPCNSAKGSKLESDFIINYA